MHVVHCQKVPGLGVEIPPPLCSPSCMSMGLYPAKVTDVFSSYTKVLIVPVLALKVGMMCLLTCGESRFGDTSLVWQKGF